MPSRPTIVRTCRKIRAINLKKFQSDLQLTDLLQCPAESLDDLALQYQSTLSTVLDVHAPLVLIKVSQRPSQPWFYRKITEAKKRRRHLERRWRRTKLEIDRFSSIEARNNVCKLTSMAKTSFYSRRIDAFSCNQKALFSRQWRPCNPMSYLGFLPTSSPATSQIVLISLGVNWITVSHTPHLHLGLVHRLKWTLANSLLLTVYQSELYLIWFRPIQQKLVILTLFPLGYWKTAPNY